MMTVGQVVTATRALTQDDFDRFASLSGDDNPIHVDPVFAGQTRFGRTVSHGMLLYGLVCGALDAHFPGAMQVDQELMFPNPAYAGDEVTVELRVTAVEPRSRTARLETLVRTAPGVMVCQGQTTVQWEP